MTKWSASRAVHVPKPWGAELIWAMSPEYVGKTLFVDAGKRLSLQYHKEKDETITLVRGTGWLWIGDQDEPLERVDLEFGVGVHVTPRTVHRLCAETDLVVVEVSTNHLTDVVRLEDDYDR